MISYDPKNWLSVVFTIRGSIIPRMMPRCSAIAVIGVVAAYGSVKLGWRMPSILHTMIGIALGLLLVFRTNASYDRFWEGRRLFGTMVNRCRDLTRQVVAYIDGAELAQTREHLRHLVCAYFRLCGRTLRDETELEPLAPLLDDRERAALEGVKHRAPVCLAWITTELTRLARQGKLTEQQLLAMDQNITTLQDSLGGCERILRTPVPFAYAQHIKIFVVLFCFTAPFAIADAMKWWTPLGGFLLAFALLGVDEIGVEIEDPFGYDANDLPVDAIGDGIEKATSDILAKGNLS